MFPSLTMRAHAGAVRPCFLRKRPHGKDGYESHCWIRSIVLVFRIERMTGFEPAVSCLGSRRATTAPHPHGRAFFRIRRTAVTCCPPAERGMAGLRVGLTGFEPATPCSQSTCATKLRHNPIFLTGLTTGESRTVKKNWKSVQILGRTLGRGGFAGG